MHRVFAAFGRALMSQMHFRMLFLTVAPFIVALLLWGAALWLGLQPLVDWITQWTVSYDSGHAGSNWQQWFMSVAKAVGVPLLAMWLILPLMVVSALVFVGLMAMPAITKHVANRYYPVLEMRHGGSFWGSVTVSASSFLLFAVLWLLTLPLALVPPLPLLVQPLLWGWLTYRVMAYDALADHASEQERKEIMRLHRRPMLAIGVASGIMGAAPTLIWMGGVVAAVLAVILLPLLAAVSIWLYILVFVFSGLWFQHYCLEALAQYRQDRGQAPEPAFAADHSEQNNS